MKKLITYKACPKALKPEKNFKLNVFRVILNTLNSSENNLSFITL